MSGQEYNRIGRFTMEGDTDLVWRPEEGEAEQVEIATWMSDIHRARLLTLASLAGRISLELQTELQEQYPTRQWNSIQSMTAGMTETTLQKIVAESQKPPYQPAHYLTPPNVKGKGLAADAVEAIVKAAGPLTLLPQ